MMIAVTTNAATNRIAFRMGSDNAKIGTNRNGTILMPVASAVPLIALAATQTSATIVASVLQ